MDESRAKGSWHLFESAKPDEDIPKHAIDSTVDFAAQPGHAAEDYTSYFRAERLPNESNIHRQLQYYVCWLHLCTQCLIMGSPDAHRGW